MTAQENLQISDYDRLIRLVTFMDIQARNNYVNKPVFISDNREFIISENKFFEHGFTLKDLERLYSILKKREDYDFESPFYFEHKERELINDLIPRKYLPFNDDFVGIKITTTFWYKAEEIVAYLEKIKNSLPKEGIITILLSDDGLSRKQGEDNFVYDIDKKSDRYIFLTSLLDGPKKGKEIKIKSKSTKLPQTKRGLNKISAKKLNLPIGYPFIIHTHKKYSINNQKYRVIDQR